ncbi:sodium-dependent transporter [Natrinema caseinilyticum]|uniref:sodium-dependent transporter n=1 Tax=Natrinema caseinilyticum TaxID=2961570 RepID=UPI0020C3FB25|nr:sodium-dependent transporter [Natrinema caseinilyticum]
MAQRESWATRTGFIFAAVGSAVGLGNIWRFPFQVGQQGGAGFVLIYLLFIGLIGFPVMLAEFVIGRRTERNPVGALKQLGSGRLRYAGWLFFTTGFLILSYYSVVAGWTVRYVLLGLQNEYVGDVAGAEGQFLSVASGVDAVFFHALFMLAIIAIVGFGIQRGIELAVKVMVPAIIVIMVGMAIYAFTLEGSGEAYSYYLSPDLGYIASEWQSILPAAAGQAFFTLSLGMGVMITYASYLGEDRNLAEDGLIIIGFDTAIALLAGLVVFPIFFSAGVDPGAPGAGAVFVTLAAAFGKLSLGGILGAVFFFTVAIAALSSAISILEVVVSYLIDEHGMNRLSATAIISVVIFLVGLPTTYHINVLNLYDLLVNNVLLVFGGFVIAIFVGWVIYDFALDELQKGIGDLGRWGTTWLWLLRVPAVVGLFIVVLLGVTGYYEFLTGDFASWLGETF